jgi:hypothetical protein
MDPRLFYGSALQLIQALIDQQLLKKENQKE